MTQLPPPPAESYPAPMPTDVDRDLAAAFLLATLETQRATSIEALAELLSTVRSEAYGEGYEAGRHDASEPPPHAGECALCRAPFVRTETGAGPSCECREAKG